MAKEEKKNSLAPIYGEPKDGSGVVTANSAGVSASDGPTKPEHDYNEGMVSGASVAVPGVEHREGEGVSIKITPEDNSGQTNQTYKEINVPWWLSGETEENGVKRFITLDDVLKREPGLKSTLKGGDFLYNILNYRKEHNLPSLEPETYRAMLGNHSMDKTAKQEKRDRVRHFLADAIQPVSDVLKAAAAYGYGKAGRTFIPARTGQGNEPGLGERMRRLEEVRAAQNWDAWANTFQKQERERLQQEAEARRAAARGRQREEDFEDFERRETYKREHQPPKSAVERMKESQANAYLDYVGRGMSHEDAAIAAGLVRRGKSGGSGSSRSTGGGRQGKSPAYPYYVGDKPYSQEHFDDAVLHALSLEYPKMGLRDLTRKLSDMSPEAKLQMFKKHGRIVK